MSVSNRIRNSHSPKRKLSPQTRYHQNKGMYNNSSSMATTNHQQLPDINQAMLIVPFMGLEHLLNPLPYIKQERDESPPCNSSSTIGCNVCQHSAEDNVKGRDNSRAFSCSYCSKGFKQASHVKAHLSVHDKSETQSCSICGKRCRHGRNFKRHMLIHEGVKPFACELCGRQFRQQTHLKTHLSSHEGVKRFKCNTCLKRFSRIDNLRRHQLIHTGLKPHICYDCGKSYSQAHHLKMHILKCKL